jgi:hypothetical protein
MLRSPWALLVPALAASLFAAAWLAGCTPNIGNSCSLSTDCSQLGDRLCDTSQPGGYCTVFNCEPDQCPNSVCVAFATSLDPSCGPSNGGRWPRFERSYCMAPCDDSSNCRGNYTCVNLDPNYLPNNETVNPNIALYNAQVVDLNAFDGGSGYSVCLVEGMAPPMPDAGVPPICLPPDAGFVQAADGGAPWPAYDGGM